MTSVDSFSNSKSGPINTEQVVSETSVSRPVIALVMIITLMTTKNCLRLCTIIVREQFSGNPQSFEPSR